MILAMVFMEEKTVVTEKAVVVLLHKGTVETRAGLVAP